MGHGLKRLDMIFQLCHVRQEGMIVVFLYSCTPSQWCVALGFNSRRWIYLSSVSGGAFYSWNNFKLMGYTRWEKVKLVSTKPRSQVPVFIENEQSQSIIYDYIRGILNKTKTQLTFNDEVEFICGCLLPEAITHGISELQGLSWQEAEDVFLQGPIYHASEVEEFNRRIAREMKNLPNKNLDDL
ncbi:PWWP domain-containing DNA repair factor 3A-like isoform X2 [Danio rerio]|uniref:PWWP domain-containing DNA repair factor 3A-like isoform X2 n=2 Tax=Danio rerio TaxID=7955 RepID=A0A8M9QCL6_DANRE|nr:PWWP domain-containing protein MUM1L1-like isoform X2 [Danio rerio]XP_021331260.1 PWWP domain-containing protein MUM1L1-like isoform X2 [Danio rerio]|eukprot:XP_009299118.1 PWWP domain-containing protein MUM1L1-like isoform X2 [Danio rerio]